LKEEYKDKDAKRLIKRLKRHKNELFTFLDYNDLSPYNNHAEQQMRKPVQTRKISQQNRSITGAKTQAILMTLFRSAELQGKNAVETVLSVVKAVIADQLTHDDALQLAA
jgi:transposase